MNTPSKSGATARLKELGLVGLLVGLLGCGTVETPDDTEPAPRGDAAALLDSMRDAEAEAGADAAAEAAETEAPAVAGADTRSLEDADRLLRDMIEDGIPGAPEPAETGTPASLDGARSPSGDPFDDLASELPDILRDERAGDEPGAGEGNELAPAGAGEEAGGDDAFADVARQLGAALGEGEDSGAVADERPATSEPTGEPSPGDPRSTAPTVAQGEIPGEVTTLRSPSPQEDAAPDPAAAAAPRRVRPDGKVHFFKFFHKQGREFLRFLVDNFSEVIEDGRVAEIEGKPFHVMLFGADDAGIEQLVTLADEFDLMGLQREQVPIRPRYIDVVTLMEALTLAGVANVWQRIDETVTTQQQQANRMQTIGTYSHRVYAKGGISQGEEAPIPIAPKIPYVFEMPSHDPFQIPRQSTGKGVADNQLTLEFNNVSSTEARGVMMAVGTAEDIQRIQAFVDSVDRPARRIMIEVQLIELEADHLSDIGLGSLQFGGRHGIVTFTPAFPGEPITQPGLPDFRGAGEIVPEIVQEGLSGIFDDTTQDIPGRFMANIHLLVRQGDARIKARPKILTLDDRPSLLHIGSEVPTFESTSVDREVTGGNFVETVSRVTTQYVGFTLNIRPRVTGDANDEIALQIEVVSNQLEGRQRVFQEDLLGIPIVSRRQYIGQTRVKNHRPLVLGGLIQEEEAESTAKVPYLGDIPVLGRLFSRTSKERTRTEVILVVTPHILNDEGIDRIATPKESIHFDTFDSVLFNDRYILKGRDVWGIDPITKQPAMKDGKIFTEDEVVDLTLLNIVKSRELVSKLEIFGEYLREDAAKLGWLKRKYPERSVYYWPDPEKEIYYKAAAIVIENIKELNAPLTFEEIVMPRREILLPTTPYRMTLSYDKYKTLVQQGDPVLRDTGALVSSRTVELLKDVAAKRSMRQFAGYVRRNGFKAERHRDLGAELRRLHSSMFPSSNAANTDDYAALFDVLVEDRIEFLVLANYFQTSLADRYVTRGAPNIGMFEADLEDFLNTTITIAQRAKRLLELDTTFNLLAGTQDGSED